MNAVTKTTLKADYLARVRANVPAEMRAARNWLVWKREIVEGAERKVPFYSSGLRRNGVLDSPRDRAQLATFDDAVAAYTFGDYAGLAIALGEGWSGVDLDDCIVNGELTECAQRIVAAADSYCEVSPSGVGLKIFGHGDIGTRGGKDGLEIYSGKRFFAVTGDRYGDETGLKSLTSAADLARKLFDVQATSPTSGSPPAPTAAGKIAEGGRNNFLFERACRLAEIRGATRPMVLGGVAALNASDCVPPLGSAEVEAIIDSALKTTAAKRNGVGDPLAARFEVLSVRDMLEHAPREDIVDGVLPDADLMMLFGESGSGKSFFALDLLVAIATGRRWRDRDVLQRRCLYVAAEGRYGVRNRLEAAVRVHQFDPDATPLRVMPRTPNLLLEQQVDLVVEAMAASGGFDLVAFDTLAQVMPGGNENAGEDMGQVLSACRRIREETGAMVLLVHHAGKDSSKGARGWSGMHAAMDAVIEVTRSGSARAATLVKSKDGDDGLVFPFNLRIVELGATPRGRRISSCTIEHLFAPVAHREREPRGDVPRVVYRAVREALALAETLSHDAAIEVAAQKLVRGVGKRDLRKQHAGRALQALQAQGFLSIDGDTVTAP